MGWTKSSGWISKCFGTGSHEKWSPQLKPPLTKGDDWYSNVSELIMSITGQTTVVGFSLILSRSGGSHSLFTSQWLSKKTNTSPVARFAPIILPLISPSRLVVRTKWSLGILATSFWSLSFNSSRVLRSSTKIISCTTFPAVLLRMLCTVRNNVDQASLWKQMIILADGKFEEYVIDLHLKEIKRTVA